MIAKVVRGYRPGGLLAYLFGPGQHEEHRDPRVVASWDGAPWAHQPDPRQMPGGQAPGEFDLDLRTLIATMEAGPRQLGLPLRTPPALPADWRQALVEGRRVPASAPGWARMWRYDAKLGDVVLRLGYVWHCPVRLAPGDRTLSDREWEQVAERLMRATGIQQAGCRWVAVRHADDHIHLMATLVSETTGKRFHPYRDFYALREECRAIERELGLIATAPADRTARPAPTRAERAKADRSRRSETPRDELHRLVSHAAATTTNGESFLVALRESGLHPRVRRDETNVIVGYTVALPGDVTASGEKVRYAGRALAPDLTWPKLRVRWAAVPGSLPGPGDAAGTGVRSAFVHAVKTARASATAVRNHAQSATRVVDSEVESIAHAAGELLTATAAVSASASDPGASDPGASMLATAARCYDRASRAPHRVLASPDHTLARELRLAARRLAAAGAPSGRGSEALALTALVVALASLVAEIAAWQHTLGRSHQARAAHETATQASGWSKARNPFTARRAAQSAGAAAPAPPPPRRRPSTPLTSRPSPRPAPVTEPGRGRTR